MKVPVSPSCGACARDEDNSFVVHNLRTDDSKKYDPLSTTKRYRERTLYDPVQVYNKRRLRATKTDDVNRFTTIIRAGGRYTILDRLPGLRIRSPGLWARDLNNLASCARDPGIIGNKARLLVALPFTLSASRGSKKSPTISSGFVFLYVPRRVIVEISTRYFPYLYSLRSSNPFPSLPGRRMYKDSRCYSKR